MATTNIYFDGTAALELRGGEGRPEASGFNAFRGGSATGGGMALHGRHANRDEDRRLLRLRALCESSEMYCSLRFEDARGCAYDLFSKRGVAILSSALTVIAVASIALGA